MATGIEAAGLVLGAIPLIISALEHYDDFASPTISFFQWRRHLRKLILELYTIRASYDQAIRILLKPFANLADQTTMMENPRSELWTEGDIADNLRDKLGLVYDSFILTIEEVSEILIEIASCLNISGSQQVITSQNLLPIVFGNPPVANSPFLRKNFEFGQRIGFTMRKNRVKAALQRLETCTSRIDTWITRADKLQDETPQSRLKLKFSGPSSAIQENARKVYGAISRGWCTETPIHIVRLLLEQRLVRSKKRRRHSKAVGLDSVAQATRFGLSLHGDCFPSSQWLHSEIRIEELPSSAQMVCVTISVPDDDYHPANLQDIENLCKVIKQQLHSSVGFCIDDMGHLKSCSSENPAEHVQQSLTLEDLLPYFEARAPITDVYGLAITLVASIFQLSHTPWLDSAWSKKNILFSRANNNLPLTVDVKYPYLAKDFSRDGPRRPDNTTINTDCSNLLALAIMLLEISSGRPIGQRRQGDEVGSFSPKDQSDFQLAERWFKQENSCGRLSCAFSRAILTCLQEYLNPDVNFDDDQYCNSFKEKALLPLEEEMEFLLYGPPK